MPRLWRCNPLLVFIDVLLYKQRQAPPSIVHQQNVAPPQQHRSAIAIDLGTIAGRMKVFTNIQLYTLNNRTALKEGNTQRNSTRLRIWVQ